MRIVEDIKYNYSSGLSLECFLRQLNENCRLCEYLIEICFVGSSVCEVTLCPKKEWSLYYNSFKPDIYLEIKHSSDTLNMIIICKLQKIIRQMNVIFNIFAGLLLTMATVFSKTSKVESFIIGAVGLLTMWVLALGLIAILFEISSKKVIRELIPDAAHKKNK